MGLISEQDFVDGSPSRSEDAANKIECYIFGILMQLPISQTIESPNLTFQFCNISLTYVLSEDKSK